MSKNLLKKICYSLAVIFFISGYALAQEPSGYYNTINGKQKEGLKTALYQVISNHVDVGYGGVWEAFYTTDKRPDNGKVWDMYSDQPGGTAAYYFTLGGGQCGNYNSEGDCYNREHSFPKSWFNDAAPMHNDLFHLYPTDGYVNGHRSNYPFGEVGVSDWTSSNGSKVGQNTFPGYTGTVFEPIDEYKGDFARTYFYMVTCYQDYASNWRSLAISSSFMRKEAYPVFQTWSLDMLLKWHRDDPVSQKEVDRNNRVFALQQNRNPFVDYPDLAEYIWGDKTDELFSVTNKAETPTLITPTNEIDIDFGEVLINDTKVLSVPMRGKGLTGNMRTLLLDNNSNYFSIPSTSIPTSYINRDEGYGLLVTYSPKVLGEHSAELVLYDGGFQGSVSVHVTAKCVAVLSIEDEMADEFEAGVYGSNI